MLGRLRVWTGLLLAASLGACAHSGVGGKAVSSNAPHAISDNLYSNYLAGRVAGGQRETGKAAQYFAEALKQDPANDIIRDSAFMLELSDGQIDQAIKQAEDITSREKNRRMPQLVLALKSLKGGDYPDARRRLAIAANGPFNALANHLIGAWAYEGEGRTDEALGELKLIEQVGAFDVFRLFHTALILDHAKRTEQAEKTYKKIIDLGGESALRIVDAYGRLLERTGRGGDAAKLYRRFLQSQPENPVIQAALDRASAQKSVPDPLIANASEGAAEVLYGLSSALLGDRSVDLPIVYLQLCLYMHPDFDVGRTLLADLFEALGRSGAANAAYARVPRNSPLALNADIQTALNLDKLGKTDQAVDQLRSLAKRKEGGLRVYVSLGDLLRSHERFDEAVHAYDDAIALVGTPGKQQWSLFYARGVSLERAGRWSEAERDLKKALALDPDQPLALNYLGYSWIEKGVNFDEALKMIGRAVDLLPNDGYVVDSLGWANYKLGRYDAAREYLERAVNLRPDDPTINDHLGDIYWRTGRQMEARYQWRRAITLGADKDIVPAIEHKIDYGLSAAAPIVSGRSL